MADEPGAAQRQSLSGAGAVPASPVDRRNAAGPAPDSPRLRVLRVVWLTTSAVVLVGLAVRWTTALPGPAPSAALAVALLPAVALAAGLVVGSATRLSRPRRGAVAWWVLTAAALVSAAAWAGGAGAAADAGAAPSTSGAWLLLGSSVLAVVGLLSLGGLRRHRDCVAAIDTAVVAVSLGALTWALVGTSVSAVDIPFAVRLLAVAGPAAGVLVLAFTLRLVLAGGTDLRTGLLLGWASLSTVADLMWSWHLLHGGTGLPLRVLALDVLAYVVLGLASTVPAGVLRRTGRWVTGGVARVIVPLTVLPLPVLLVVRAAQGSMDGVLVVTAGSALVTGLVVLRALLVASGTSTRPGPGARAATVRLVCAFLVLALLPLAGLTSFAVRESRGAIDREVTDSMRVTAAVSAEYVTQELGGLQTLLRSYASRRLLASVVDPRTPAQYAELDHQLRSLDAAHPAGFDARLLDLGGARVRSLTHAPPHRPDTQLVRGALGSSAPYVSASFSVQDGAGRAVAVSAVVRDRQGVPRAVLALAFRLDALDAFAQQLADVQEVQLTVADQSGRVVTGSDAAPVVRAALEDALTGGSGTVEDAGRILSFQPAGRLRWAVVSSVPTSVAFATSDVVEARVVAASVLLAQLLLAGMVLGVRSDLRRRSAQHTLRDREAHLSSVLEAAGDAFLSWDAGGQVTAWNAQAVRLFGHEREQALGARAVPLLLPDGGRAALQEQVERLLGGAGSDGGTVRLELVARDASGRTFPAELTLWTSGGPEGLSVNGFVRDLTERRRVEAELADAHSAALEASRLKSEFVANMSHEIRTPMNGVLGMTSLLRETALDPVQRDYADTIGSCAETLLNVIDDILDFSKIEAGRLDVEAVDFELRPLVEDVVSLLGGVARARGLEVVAWVDPELPAGLRGDPHRLRQVLGNLVSNAVKYTASGEVVVTVEPVPAAAGSAAGAASVVRFSVRDTGIGIPAEQQTRLFEPFQQADASMTRRYGGTGLGLTISRQLVGLMDGTLDVDSTPGVGSTFWFEIPLPVATSTTPAPRLRWFDDVRALVVDDNATNRRVLEQHLSAWSVETSCAADARTALALLREAVGTGRPFDVALLDRHMPGTDGLELAATVHADPALAGVRLLVLSSFDEAGDRAAATAVGVGALLPKPVREAQLFDCLGRLLGADAVVPEQARPQDTTRRRNGRVLLAEDNAVNQQVALAMLESLGFGADVAHDGREAVDMLRAGSYAAVLMDCQMPRLDGFGATREIRETPGEAARTPVIALTASALASDREKCLAAGMDDFVSKPLRRETLAAALNRWVGPAAHEAAADGPDVAEPTAPELPSDLPPVPGTVPDVLDRALLTELRDLAGDHWDALRDDYLTGLPGQLAELDRCWASGDLSALGRAAHVLKGSSATMAAHRLAASAGCLELAAAGRRADQLSTLLETVRSDAADATAALSVPGAEPSDRSTRCVA